MVYKGVMQSGILSFVKAELAAITPAQFGHLSSKTGVPEGTIRRVHYGETADPRIGSIEPLYHHFKRLQRKRAKRRQAG